LEIFFVVFALCVCASSGRGRSGRGRRGRRGRGRRGRVGVMGVVGTEVAGVVGAEVAGVVEKLRAPGIGMFSIAYGFIRNGL
jgi:hypothetical protein